MPKCFTFPTNNQDSGHWSIKNLYLISAGYQQVQKYTIVQTSSSEYSPTGLLAGQPGTEPAMSWLIISVLVTHCSCQVVNLLQGILSHLLATFQNSLFFLLKIFLILFSFYTESGIFLQGWLPLTPPWELQKAARASWKAKAACADFPGSALGNAAWTGGSGGFCPQIRGEELGGTECTSPLLMCCESYAGCISWSQGCAGKCWHALQPAHMCGGKHQEGLLIL